MDLETRIKELEEQIKELEKRLDELETGFMISHALLYDDVKELQKLHMD